MSEWNVVLVIVTLVGLGVTLWRAAYSYTKTTTQLQETLKSLQDLITKIQADMDRNSHNNSESHRRIFEWLEKHDEMFDDQEKKMIKFEDYVNSRKEVK